MQQLIPLFITISGYILGLGAVTVIDLHGFLARKSKYWTLATTRTHKITKPLIWLGIILVITGVTIFNSMYSLKYFIYLVLLYALLIINGLFLSFVISPYLLNQEKKGKSEQLLPSQMQIKITISFIFSFVGWWGSIIIFLASLIKVI